MCIYVCAPHSKSPALGVGKSEWSSCKQATLGRKTQKGLTVVCLQLAQKLVFSSPQILLKKQFISWDCARTQQTVFPNLLTQRRWKKKSRRFFSWDCGFFNSAHSKKMQRVGFPEIAGISHLFTQRRWKRVGFPEIAGFSHRLTQRKMQKSCCFP